MFPPNIPARHTGSRPNYEVATHSALFVTRRLWDRHLYRNLGGIANNTARFASSKQMPKRKVVYPIVFLRSPVGEVRIRSEGFERCFNQCVNSFCHLHSSCANSANDGTRTSILPGVHYMSMHETPMTEGFWETCANGAFLSEYCLVQRAPGCGRRAVDAIILPDEPQGRATAGDYPSLAGRNVIVVQTKRGRMGMYLMGQAVFSAQLAVRASFRASFVAWR